MNEDEFHVLFRCKQYEQIKPDYLLCEDFCMHDTFWYMKSTRRVAIQVSLAVFPDKSEEVVNGSGVNVHRHHPICMLYISPIVKEAVA